jgi:DNA-binding CsgD family transcriptional regulator
MKDAQAPDYLQLINSLTVFFQANELSEDEICQALALRIFPEHPAATAGIFEMHTDGTYSLASIFGLPESVKGEWQGIPLRPVTPVVEAMRSGKVTWVANQEDLISRFPAAYIAFKGTYAVPIVAIPLLSKGSMAGAIAISGSDVQLTEECATYLEVVSGLVALKLQANDHLTFAVNEKVREPLGGKLLTAREELVQGLMSKGKTNRQIAADLDYSESTIRQDAISLFAKLGVKTRREAGELLHEVKG